MTKNILITTLVAVLATVLTVKVMAPSDGGQGISVEKKQESTYERVMRTGEINCGYATWPPFLYKEPNSGELVGASVDMMEEIGNFLGLKINWVEEVGFGNYLEGLKTGRYDMMCITEWPAPERIKQQAISKPVYYSSIYAYVRADDDRFDGDLSKINSPDVKVVYLEGSSDEPIVKEGFEKADQYPLPQSADHSQLLLSLTTGKGDVVFVDEGIEKDFNVNNPGKIRKVADVDAVRFFAETFSFSDEDGKLKGVIDATIDHLVASGFIRETLNKYEISTHAPKIVLDK